ncbi:MAG TPA: hypothetical protein VFC44_01305 [Candidatus Saccharimonadales bacterium]|nr:hypothetical protein [Candidatus Saccharimonadales bacterium]
MKTMMPNSRLTCAAILTAVFVLHASGLFATGAEENTQPQFPHIIEYELGASRFSPGDQITITAVHGDRKHIEPGGGYLVEGTYALASGDGADLAFFCTSRGPSGPTPVQDGQRIKITKGAGKFHLYATNLADGWLHISFYPNNSYNSSSHGGVYFGEKDRENTVMRNHEMFHEITDKLTGNQRDTGAPMSSKANRALLAYLGNPVPAPDGMDSRYNKESLLKAFTGICQRGNLIITKLAVDDSEFPFLVYGTLDGAHTLPKKLFEGQEGYAYGGCVRGSDGEDASYFAVNIVPPSQYPPDQEKACNRRLMLRLQMLADKAQQTIQR